jgi:hypothetical protein
MNLIFVLLVYKCKFNNLLFGVFSSTEKAEEAKIKIISSSLYKESNILILHNVEHRIEKEDSKRLFVLEEQIEDGMMTDYILICDNRDKLIKVLEQYYTLNNNNKTTFSMTVADVNINEIYLTKDTITKSFIMKMTDTDIDT